MTILFDIYPAIGHFNASFVLANELLSRQHRIVYCVEPEYVWGYYHSKRIAIHLRDRLYGLFCLLLRQ